MKKSIVIIFGFILFVACSPTTQNNSEVNPLIERVAELENELAALKQQQVIEVQHPNVEADPFNIENWLKIEKGMSIVQVEALLGKPLSIKTAFMNIIFSYGSHAVLSPTVSFQNDTKTVNNVSFSSATIERAKENDSETLKQINNN